MTSEGETTIFVTAYFEYSFHLSGKDYLPRLMLKECITLWEVEEAGEALMAWC